MIQLRKNHMVLAVCFVLLVAVSVFSQHARGVEVPSETGDFSLQVSPSPLVTTVKPDQKTTVQFKIRNNSSAPESLKIEPRKFRFNDTTGRVEISSKETPEVAQWVSLDASKFVIKPGETVTRTLMIDLPPETAFSYAFALLIQRDEDKITTSSGRKLEGSIALFTLINVDRPGAKREVEIAEFSATQKVYEFLPAEFTTKVSNTGNTIAQPYGNIYINGGLFEGDTPHATLKVNENSAYILPGTTRSLSTQWSDGFPVYTTTQDASGAETRNLTWNWKDINTFRFGKYSATLVAVYNDGERDIPIVKKIEFWVIPWRVILAILAIIGLFIYLQIWIVRRRTKKAVEKALAKSRSNRQ